MKRQADFLAQCYCCGFAFLALDMTFPSYERSRSLSGRPLVDPQTGGELLDAEDCPLKFIKLGFLAVGKDRCELFVCLHGQMPP